MIRSTTELGLVGGVALWIRKRVGAHDAIYSLNPRHANHPLYFRLGSSDLDVFDQIFIDLEYAPLCDMREVHLVVDCGANVGYSSAFFLSQFPSCHVIAVEPEPSNFAMLKRNLHAYGARAEAVHAGIWPQSALLKVSQERYRDGREWTVQVRPCEAHEEPDFRGVSIASLLDSSGFARISLLKMDIEGAEAIVFQGKVDWLDRVDAIAIELHDDSSFGRATEIFHAAIHGRGFEESCSGELTICRRAEPGAAPDLARRP
jgi:FkbM family methyltransferase